METVSNEDLRDHEIATETFRMEPNDMDGDASEHLQPDLDASSNLLAMSFANLQSSTKTVRIGLDDAEEALFATLIATKEAYERGEISLDGTDKGETTSSSCMDTDGAEDNDDQNQTRLVEIRVAGGWVRDKLLGLQTHDVDVTVDSMSGVQFATLIQAYLKSLPPSHPLSPTKNPKMAVIAANPAQSKHLETATMKLQGIDIDICHLRAEEIYNDESRIPTAIVGTPFQDAQRRDFTINALFFNLKTRRVEDWTRRGLQDLRQRVLVTPIDPLTTFEDDPLRVLRAIRFSVRYQLQLDQQLEVACQLRKIHKALQIKVSRERVGKELEGMLSGKGAHPQRALNTLARLKLAGCVFCFPTTGSEISHCPTTINKSNITHASGTIMGHIYEGQHDELNHLRELGWEESQLLLEFLPQLHQFYRQRLPRTTTRIERRLFPLAVFLLPFRKLKYEEVKSNNQNSSIKEFSVTSYMFKEGIKFKNRDCQGIAILMENVDRMAEFLTDVATARQKQVASSDGKTTNADLHMCRLKAGLVLRATKELWITTLLLACLLKMRQSQLGEDGIHDSPNDATTAYWLDLMELAYKTILNMNLDGCWNAKPLLDGKAVIEALKLPRGPLIASYLDEQMRWMLLNPKGSKEECEQHLHSVKRRRDAEAGTSMNGSGSNGHGQPSLKKAHKS